MPRETEILTRWSCDACGRSESLDGDRGVNNPPEEWFYVAVWDAFTPKPKAAVCSIDCVVDMARKQAEEIDNADAGESR